jgi:hypothetical protein
MTQHSAYKWDGALYCEGDIVAVLTLHEPWTAWRDAGGDPTEDDTETELNEIAAMFQINRRDNLQVAERGFPRRLHHLPEDFCVFCLRWFK